MKIDLDALSCRVVERLAVPTRTSKSFGTWFLFALVTCQMIASHSQPLQPASQKTC